MTSNDAITNGIGWGGERGEEVGDLENKGEMRRFQQNWRNEERKKERKKEGKKEKEKEKKTKNHIST